MVGGVEMIEVGGVAPAVGFAGEEGDALAGLGGFNEGGEIRGQRGERELVDETMAFVIPSLANILAEQKRDGKSGKKSGRFFHG